MKHLIKKQQLVLTIPPEMDAFQAQHEASRYFREALLPALEQIFDELSGEGEVIRLDHLSIDMGGIAESDLAGRGLDIALYHLIKEEIRRAIDGEPQRRPASRLSVRESVLAQWWYYMEHGRLPWNADAADHEWHEQVLEMLAVDFSAIGDVRAVILRDAKVCFRVSAQHDDWFLENLLGVMTSSGQEGLGEDIQQACRVIEFLEREHQRAVSGISEDMPLVSSKKSPASPLVRRLLRAWGDKFKRFINEPSHMRKAYIWRLLLAEAAGRPEEFAVAGGAKVLLDWVWSGLPLMGRVMTDPAFSGSGQPFILLIRNRLKTGQDRGEGRNPKGQRAARKRGGQEDGLGQALSGAGEKDTRNKSSEAAEKDTTAAEEITEEGIYISNAGVILLHAFLTAFFTRLQLWDGVRFVDEEARQKAIFLLHFLAMGEREAAEYELVFAKMLCGYSLEMPLPGAIPLSVEECEESILLLETVIERWEKLQGSTVEGLREGFLRRSGKIFEKNGRLCLQVEAMGVDVLLDYLPWNLSLVKLPWLKDIIYVEWR